MELNTSYIPFQNLMLEVVTLDTQLTYPEAVSLLSSTWVNAPGYVILCNANRSDD